MLIIRESELDALRRHGEETYPHECCGVMLGRVDGDGRVVEAGPAERVFAAPSEPYTQALMAAAFSLETAPGAVEG